MNRRETVKFEANVPQHLTLKYAAGKIVPGNFGDQVMWGLAGDKVMFLPLNVAQRVNDLNPQAGDTVGIVKMQSNGQTRWNVWFTPATEIARAHRGELPPPDPDESQTAQQIRGSLENLREGKPAAAPRVPTPITAGASVSALAPAQATAVTSSHSNTGNLSTGNALVDEANAIIDAYAVVLDRALTTYQGRIKPDEVRSILLSAYIQRGKAGKTYAA